MNKHYWQHLIAKAGIAGLLLFFWAVPVGAAVVEPTGSSQSGEPKITAQSAVLIDAETGQIIYEKNARQKRPPASTTKIMTVVLALEMGDLNKLVTISPRADAVGEASLGLSAGEQFKLEELIKGALLRSANDACVAIAEEIGGSEEEFIWLMNRKAIALGLYQTSYRNPNGLPAAGHYSSAYDLATLARYALRDQLFAELVKTKYAVVEQANPSRKKTVKNTNRLLWQYPGATGVKTGTTIEAGHCLVASAMRNQRTLIAVVLNSRNRFNDATVLLDYGFYSQGRR